MGDRTEKELDELVRDLETAYLARICPRCRSAVMFMHPEADKLQFRFWMKCLGCGFSAKKDK